MEPTSLLPLWLLAPQVSLGFYFPVFPALVWFILVSDVLSQAILPSTWIFHFSCSWRSTAPGFWEELSPAPAVWNGCQCTLLTLWESSNISLIKIVVVFVLPGSPFYLHQNDFASSLHEASVGGNSE